MSQFTNYIVTSKNYDRTRVPVGVEIILGLLAESKKPLKDQRLLDAGCGTGNYLSALQDHLGRLSGLDANEGMLSVARKKFTKARHIDLKQGCLPSLPYDAETFDGVICNQVIHHFDPAGNFAQLRELVKEAGRILKPGGVLVFNTCSQEQIREGYWTSEILPEAIARMLKRYARIDDMTAMFSDSGFGNVRQTVPLDAILQGEKYLDTDGPFDKQWRDGDSTWTLLTPQELPKALERISKMKREKILKNFIRERERMRKKVGQCVFVSGRKRP